MKEKITKAVVIKKIFNRTFIYNQILGGRLLLFTVTLFLLLIGQKARTRPVMIGLFNCPITGVRLQNFGIGHCPINDFCVNMYVCVYMYARRQNQEKHKAII